MKLIYVYLLSIYVKFSGWIYLYTICMPTLQRKLDVYMSSSMFHCFIPVSCICAVCMTSLMVLWRLCCVFGAVSGLLRAERVANEWPVRGNEVRSAGCHMASSSLHHWFTALPASPLPTWLTGEICFPVATALNTVLNILWDVCGKTEQIRETEKIIYLYSLLTFMVIALCALWFSIVSMWTVLYCLDFPFHWFHSNHTSSSCHATYSCWSWDSSSW